ncbi:MAG: hypothetical protein QG608_795 [Actinomycetota bacterium]|nr:hypothetical protein [Actinomycetota bacterium]
MIARVGERARATADADTTWRAGTRELTLWLEQAAAVDLGDHFEFFLGEPRTIQAEGPEGGFRFAVQARVAGRLFERIRLDVNVVLDDPRPVEVLALRNLFDFADLPEVIVPAIRPEQQLAEKLHAYTRDYGHQENSRAKDLYDMLLIAEQLALPCAGILREACRTTFSMRQTSWPPALSDPPSSWNSAWRGFVAGYGAPFPELTEAYHALRGFWDPLLHQIQPTWIWNAGAWKWMPPALE